MGEGRRQPAPSPSPDRGGEKWVGSQEVEVTIVNLGFFCPTMSLKY
ncbi:MAG: hypothetical protein F6K48_05735 [Okeania sp. SIO3H1]|nr:hypothetical protein [Okeania sp. SIO3H1]